ncbi:uncharacterized protein LOC119672786 [Teleopsis dalmanni]|uniref:uncharacterized protein LOC119672786 n=1 Tax=Teleopsis dalmanni TaxID=139649 RepID=UPI0018CCE423|nr:uncharacterized protein LOC119672786 [Teleopsis dalmanni]
MFFKFLTISLAILWIIFILRPVDVNGQCNACAADTGVACVSEISFKICVGGYPNGDALTCPTGYVCSTANSSICLPKVQNITPTCSDCNKCDATSTFACTGLTTFALCLGTGTISDIVGNCAPSHICSIDYPQICGNATTGISATCPSVIDGTTPGTTSSTPTTGSTASTVTPFYNATYFCSNLQQKGRFPVGTDLSTTCRQYVYCFLNGGAWHGQIYNCPGSTYFNSTSQNCGVAIPPRCLGTVRSLSLFEIDLDSYF